MRTWLNSFCKLLRRHLRNTQLPAYELEDSWKHFHIWVSSPWRSSEWPCLLLKICVRNSFLLQLKLDYFRK
ncbi:unnamed protein product, partial [Vitis vinifera]